MAKFQGRINKVEAFQLSNGDWVVVDGNENFILSPDIFNIRYEPSLAKDMPPVETCPPVDKTIIPFATTDEQIDMLVTYLSVMQSSGMTQEFVTQTLKLAIYDQGLFDLVKLWYDSNNPSNRTQIIEEIRASIKDYGYLPIIEGAPLTASPSLPEIKSCKCRCNNECCDVDKKNSI